MDIVGGGQVVEFSKEDELPHTPGPQEYWQESFVIIWYDEKQRVGGFFRLGHEPNWQGGKTQLFSNIFSPEGVYHRTAHHVLEARHRLKNGFVSGDDTLRYEVVDGRLTWHLQDTGVEMHIEVDDFVPPIDAHKRVGAESSQSYTGAHVDASCSVTGTVTVKGKTYAIKDALAVRDHGWGPRDWYGLLSHRWTVATFDRDNSFVAVSFVTADNKMAKFGWVIRDNRVIFADQIEIRAMIGEDGNTNFGGTTRLKLTTGEVYEVKFEPYYPAIASWVHKTICYDSMCRATWGDKIGFGVFENSNNLQGGTLQPVIYDGAYGPDGWHKAELRLD